MRQRGERSILLGAGTMTLSSGCPQSLTQTPNPLVQVESGGGVTTRVHFLKDKSNCATPGSNPPMLPVTLRIRPKLLAKALSPPCHPPSRCHVPSSPFLTQTRRAWSCSEHLSSPFLCPEGFSQAPTWLAPLFLLGVLADMPLLRDPQVLLLLLRMRCPVLSNRPRGPQSPWHCALSLSH